jgi:MFS family permease
VVGVEEDLLPSNSSDRPIYYPPQKIAHVLEVSAGTVAQLGITIGDEFRWEFLVYTYFMDNKRIFGLHKNVFFLGLVSLFNDFSAEMVYSVMPAFLTTVLGAPPVFLGFMEGFVDAFASVLKIFSGWLSDKWGNRKWFAVIGYALSVSTRSVLALVTGLGQVFSLRVIDRLGKGLRDSPRDALLSESVESHELGKSFGYHRAMDTTGAILGPLGAVILLPLLANDYRAIFMIAFVLGILAIITFLFVREVKTRAEIIPKIPVAFTFSLAKFSSSFRLFIFAVFLFGLGVMPVSLMLLKASDVGLAVTSIPAMYLVYTISFALFAIPFGRV